MVWMHLKGLLLCLFVKSWECLLLETTNWQEQNGGGGCP